MVHHGFGGVGTHSPPKDEIAAEISKLPCVIYANVVEGPQYDIIFEFDPDKSEMTHEELIARIKKIQGVHTATIWTILSSYKDGKPKAKPHNY